MILEWNKSCIELIALYFTNSCQQIWVRANQPFILYTFYTSHLRRKSTMRRCFYHTDLVQNAVVHNFSRQIAFVQYSGPSKHAWTFSESVQKISNIWPVRPADYNFWQEPNLQRNFKRVTLPHDKGFIVYFLLMVL